MLPAAQTMASRDARRLAIVLREVGGDGAPVADGWMACDEPGSWADYAAGLGVQGPVTEADLDRLVAFYRARGRAPKIQVTPFQHPSLHDGLRRRGFVADEIETTLAAPTQPDPSPMPGLRFRPLDPCSESDVQAFVDSQMRGFYADRPPPPGLFGITRRVVRSPRCRLYLLMVDGQVVGSGGLESYEQSAVLIAGTVHPEARRRGVQQAFIRFRLAQAAAQGIEYCLIGSLVGGPTERNALRCGFAVAYTQTVLVARSRSARSRTAPA